MGERKQREERSGRTGERKCVMNSCGEVECTHKCVYHQQPQGVKLTCHQLVYLLQVITRYMCICKCNGMSTCVNAHVYIYKYMYKMYIHVHNVYVHQDIYIYM